MSGDIPELAWQTPSLLRLQYRRVASKIASGKSLTALERKVVADIIRQHAAAIPDTAKKAAHRPKTIPLEALAALRPVRTTEELAEFFGVSVPAINKALKKIPR